MQLAACDYTNLTGDNVRLQIGAHQAETSNSSKQLNKTKSLRGDSWAPNRPRKHSFTQRVGSRVALLPTRASACSGSQSDTCLPHYLAASESSCECQRCFCSSARVVQYCCQLGRDVHCHQASRTSGGSIQSGRRCRPPATNASARQQAAALLQRCFEATYLLRGHQHGAY